MKTGKAVMIRKPKDMAELLKLTKKYLEEAEEVIIEKTIKLPSEDTVFQVNHEKLI